MASKILKTNCAILSACFLFLYAQKCSSMPANNIIVVGPNNNNDILYRVNENRVERDNSINPFRRFDFRKALVDIEKKIQSASICLACKFSVGIFQSMVENGATENEIGNLVLRVCKLFKIEKPAVCEGVVKLFKKELTMVITRVALDPNEICNLVFACGRDVNPLHNWTVPLPPFPKPPVTDPILPEANAPVLKVLHLSDIHLDPYYKEGSNAKCEEPLCCRESSGLPETPEDAAGYWGDYRNCDTPLRTLENLLDHINKTHELDYVIWTGDIPPHDIWNNSRDEAIYLLHEVTNLLHKYLGKVPIFPALGNHESSPVNSFPIPFIVGNESISWLYKEVGKAWSYLVPDSPTVKLGAYYSVLVKPGFRIISLNMNYCNSLNWWLLINSTDPTEELSWLINQLQMAEIKKEKVHIIGHIPPGEPDCLGVWSSNYYRIINRYESTVTAQFFGHTHQDEFEIFYDKTGPKPRATSIVYIGPSVTTFDGVNPGYRIYSVDGRFPNSSFVVLDHETYYTNLTESNLYGTLKWNFEYSVKDAYNMTSLLPRDWDNFVDRLNTDEQLFNKFYLYYRKMTDFAVPECDDSCKQHFFCRLRRGQSNDPLFCI